MKRKTGKAKPLYQWGYTDIIKHVLMLDDMKKCSDFLDEVTRSSLQNNPEFKKKKHTFDSARKLLASNLGYFAGYYDNETAAKIMKLCRTVHPIFGSSEQMAKITPEKAFEMGKKLGAKAK
jgi:hypothetical protein